MQGYENKFIFLLLYINKTIGNESKHCICSY